MRVIVCGEAYECARAERGADFARLYDEDGALLVSFTGIRSFDGYSIEDGEWTEVQPEPDYPSFVAGLMEGYGDE